MRYLAGVESSLHGTGLPYGYTITIFSSGQVLTQARGVPTVGQIFLFAAGAAFAYGLLRLVTGSVTDKMDPDLQLAASPNLVRAGAIHSGSIGAAIGSVALIALIDSGAVWPVGGLLATLLYLCGLGLELGLREEAEHG